MYKFVFVDVSNRCYNS